MPETTAVVTTDDQYKIMERVLVDGDLAELTPPERASYYMAVCQSCGLNPLTKPFDYLVLNGKLRLYANRNCADQLRSLRGITSTVTARDMLSGDLYVVTVRASLADGRADESTGAVCLSGLKGEALANALMKAETKAKRRATLSLVGLSMMDESEVVTVPGARRADIDPLTGEVLDKPKRLPPPDQAAPEEATTALTDGELNAMLEELKVYHEATDFSEVAHMWETTKRQAAAMMARCAKSGDRDGYDALKASSKSVADHVHILKAEYDAREVAGAPEEAEVSE